MDTKTPRQRDIDRRLRDHVGVGLDDWLADQRRDGLSFRAMARELLLTTGDSVSDETLRTWLSEPAA